MASYCPYEKISVYSLIKETLLSIYRAYSVAVMKNLIMMSSPNNTLRFEDVLFA
jgi:hypothetical protein